MTLSTALDKVEAMAQAIEFLVHFSDKDVWSPEDEMAAVCALAERFDADAIVGYTTINSRSHVATFQTAAYPRLPTWPFSKLHDVPVTRPYAGTCAQAICEGTTIYVVTSLPKPVSIQPGESPARNLASARSSQLQCSASTADPWARLSRHAANHGIPSIKT